MNNNVKSFKDLLIWKEGMILVDDIYSILERFPKSEVFAPGSQMRRAAIAVPSNIAEGQQRNHTKEFVQFLSVARGSLGELETQGIISKNQHYIDQIIFQKFMSRIEHIRKMIYGLQRSLLSNK